jgi:lipopolysaccharide export system permease protein
VRILDRQRYWSFLKAYVICYFSLGGLYVVIDAFSNLDEFTQRADGVVEPTRVICRFYFVRMSPFVSLGIGSVLLAMLAGFALRPVMRH